MHLKCFFSTPHPPSLGSEKHLSTVMQILTTRLWDEFGSSGHCCLQRIDISSGQVIWPWKIQAAHIIIDQHLTHLLWHCLTMFHSCKPRTQKCVRNRSQRGVTYIGKSVRSSKLYPLMRWCVSAARTILLSGEHTRHCTRTPSQLSCIVPSISCNK